MSKQALYILDPSKDITGAFRCAKNEAKLLRDEFDVVLVLPSSSKISEEELAAFERVLRVPVVNLRKSLSSLLLYLPALIYSSWKMYRSMQKNGCTLLQVNDYYLMHGVMLRLLGYRGKIVTWVRIDPSRYGSFFSKYWLKLDYRMSDHIVAVSEFILSKLPVSPKNRLVYDPVPESEVQRSVQSETKSQKVVYVGNYIHGKGQQYAIEAFAKIADAFPEAQLHFYGGDMGLEKNRQYRKSLQSLAEGLSCADRIIFHGFVNDTYRVLQEGYMALNFSESESFSMTCLEASAAGLSVIATRSGGPEEIIADHQTGYLVDRGDVAQMAEAMADLLSDTQKNSLFGQRARIHVKEKFSDMKFKHEIIDLLKADNKVNG